MALSIDQFLDQLTGSGLLSAEDVSSVLSSSPNDQRPQDGEALARELVKQKKLTKFQAEQVIAGKGKSLTLGNYVILDKLGQGGMGMVLKAEHKRMKRLVALKVMSPAAVKTPDSLKRFHREVEAAAKLRHTNIVAADDADEAKGTHFLVMEYVDGSDLSALVKKRGPLPVEQAIRCIIQAARGLEYAHEQGVIHRDIKPANLLIDAKGTVKILDMGLARIDDSVGGSSEGAGLTSTGTIMGTVDYMSPEQAMDTKHADARSDIYSLGCSLYYLLTGKVVYDGDTMMKKLMAHRESAIPDLASGGCQPSELRSDDARNSEGLHPPLAELQRVFRRMVAKRPEDRQQSMTEVIAELERCLSGGSATVVYERRSDSVTAVSASGSGNDLQDFLRQISGGEPATATAGKASGTVATPSSADAETMISSAGDGGTDPRTDQTLTLEQAAQQFGEPRGVSPRTVRGLTHPGSPKRKLTLLFGSIAAAVVVVLAVVFAMRGKSGTLNLDIHDELIEVTVGDTGRKAKGKKLYALRVPLGEHVLHIQREDLTFKTDPVAVVKGEPASIKVERVGRRVRAMQGKTLLGFKEPPSSTSRASNEPPPKTPVEIKQRAGKYEVVAPNYQAKVNSDGLLENLVIDGTTLIETTDFGGGGDFGRIGSGGFVTAKQSDATLVFQQAGDYRLRYEFDADGFTVRAMVSKAAAKRDAVDMKDYFLFYQVLFSNEATMVRPLDGSDEFQLPPNDLAQTARFVVVFKNGIELEVSSLPTQAFFNRQREPYRWSHGYLALDTDNIFRFDIRKPASVDFVRRAIGEPANAPAPAKSPFDAKQALAYQEAWAKHLGVAVEQTNGIGMKLVLIPPGEFKMGEFNNVVDVKLTRAYWLGKYEVTQAEYRAVMKDNPSYFAATGEGRDVVAGLQTDQFPADQIRWADANEFCRVLTEQEQQAGRLQAGWEYRLPTEAQWEFACRAGTTARFSFGDAESPSSDFAWFAGNSENRTHEIGQKLPNAWGLHDMFGNVNEWCRDGLQPFAERTTVDPEGSTMAGDGRRVLRGGYWNFGAAGVSFAYRFGEGPAIRYFDRGFRVALVQIAPFDAAQARAHQEVWTDWLGPKLKHADFFAEFDGRQGWQREGDAVTTTNVISGQAVLPDNTRNGAIRLTYLLRDANGIQINARDRKTDGMRELYMAEDTGKQLGIVRLRPGSPYNYLAKQEIPATIPKDAPRTLEFRLVGDTLTATLNGSLVATAKDTAIPDGNFALVALKGVLVQKVEYQKLDDLAAKPSAMSEREAAQWSLDHEGLVELEIDGSNEPKTIKAGEPLPHEPFTVRGLNFGGRDRVTDSVLQQLLPGRAKLKAIVISHAAEITDAGLALVAAHPQLELLSLSPTIKFTDESVALIAGIKSLKSLSLSGRTLTSRHFQQFLQLSNLEALSYDGTATSQDFARLSQRLSKLNSLAILGENLNEITGQHLAEHAPLRRLHTDGATVETLIGLAKLTQLKFLTIATSKPIDSADWLRLKSLRQLESLHVFADLSDETSNALRQELPNCKITVTRPQ